MVKQLLGVLMLFGSLNALAQETFDVVTYTAPAGWEREDLQGKAMAFTRKDARTGTWGRIALYKSVKGSGNLQSDFASEWNLLAAKPYKVGQPSRTEEGIVHNGWRAMGGLAQFTFNDAPAGVSLTTISNGDLTLSVLVLLSSNIHQKDVDEFMASIKLPPIAVQTRAAPAPQANSGTKPRVIGNWNHSVSSYPQDWKAASWSGAGYTTRRYEFKDDGTYRFTMRSFFMMNSDIYIVKEHGTFIVSGNQLTVVPQSSVFETYTKKNNADELGSLKATKKISLDTVTYNTTLNYSPGMREWNLVLQASKPTERDGNFDSNTLFTNAWFYNQRFDAELTSSTGK